jgi:uncharacterized protein YdeI (YjbR/CyaY-like superfamily)
MNPDVDRYIEALKAWRPEITALRKILLSCGLQEEFKWSQPCYTSNGKNIAILGCFKSDCVISFFKGSLLEDPEGILQRPGENTQTGRVIRFTDTARIIEWRDILRDYILEAVSLEESGQHGQAEKETAELQPSEELLAAFKSDPPFREAFAALTKGRQRAYHMHFNAASQSDTRSRRIAKYRERIMNGKGIHDCVCGLSKRMPNCDGSHKYA